MAENANLPKLYVIKIGGNVIDNDAALRSFADTFSALDGHKILVHGGGKLATQLAEKMGVQQTMVEGRRITDAETLKIVTMVYAGLINKNIVALLQANHCNALGLSGADGNSILAHKRTHAAMDYGFAGDVDAVNAGLFGTLLNAGITPVVCPITHNRQGLLLNTNADTIAQSVATSLSQTFAVSLIYCFEKLGVLSDAANDESVIETINESSFEKLKADGIITAGMVPKIANALSAVQSGVANVTIGHANELVNLAHQKAGTTIVGH